MSLDLQALLGNDADSLLGHSAKAFPSEGLVLPGPDYLSRVFTDSDRSPTVLRNLGTLFNHGRLGGTGYVSILPVDQGIEHSAAASFSKNPAYFDPPTSWSSPSPGSATPSPPRSARSAWSPASYVHRIPFIVKLNHNAFLHYPTPTTRSCSPP
jgi:class I fructose-bisphosphate aldolase